MFALLVFISKQVLVNVKKCGFKIACTYLDFLTFNHVSPIEIKHIFSKRDLAKRAAAVASITVNNTDKFTALKLAHITRARRGVILWLTGRIRPSQVYWIDEAAVCFVWKFCQFFLWHKPHNWDWLPVMRRFCFVALRFSSLTSTRGALDMSPPERSLAYCVVIGRGAEAGVV